MTKQEARSYLDAMMKENKFVNPYREKALSIAIAALREQEKPLSAFPAPIDCYNGLKRKFLVFKSDTGEMIENCFVLRPDKDPAAVEALRAYAKATDNETLSTDIINWVGAEEHEERENPKPRKIQKYPDSKKAWTYYTTSLHDPYRCSSNCYHYEYDGQKIIGVCNGCGRDIYEVKPEYVQGIFG